MSLVSITALDRDARAELTKWDWATLRFRRVWGVEALKCEGCGGGMKFIAVIKDRDDKESNAVRRSSIAELQSSAR